MERTPEPQTFADAAEAREYATMDNDEANRAFVDALVANGCTRGELLDLGTGPADIPLLLADRCPDAMITGVDLSKDILKIARLSVANAGHSRVIRLMQIDAQQLPFADRHFDGVFSNTILHHVADPIAYFREARRVLASSGALVIRDLFRPATPDEVDRLVVEHASDATDGQRDMFRASLHAAYTVEEVREMLDETGLVDAGVEASSDRHLTVRIQRS